MHCWKSVNLNKQYGPQRMFIISLLTMLLSFTTIYALVSAGLSKGTLHDDYALLFMAGIFMLYPLHKVLHLLPLLFAFNKLKIQSKQHFYIPQFTIRVKDPISKMLFLFSLLTPFVVVTGTCLYFALRLPAYAHYFTILLSLHIGLCASDAITLFNILRSPRCSYVEENDEGFEILVREA
ncbi:DUF3267 domain-containing protein [Bacillus testis]|uniref:DUF3267 domain-containing protein n=1 Tax=Bacillus testis TaxID=1622072 RepID=UPI00067F1614|nr:DUF3267 domain-containing protein [Bacillus testis]